jgi:hypothetical protein
MANKSMALRSDHMGDHASEGTRLLWGVMRVHGWSQNKLANELGADSGKVNRWLHGMGSPSRKWSRVLLEKFDIPFAAWDEKPRRPIVLRVGTAA